jgi:hypothetical protein
MKIHLSTDLNHKTWRSLDRRGASRRLVAFPAVRTKKGGEYLRAVRETRQTGGAA